MGLESENAVRALVHAHLCEQPRLELLREKIAHFRRRPRAQHFICTGVFAEEREQTR